MPERNGSSTTAHRPKNRISQPDGRQRRRHQAEQDLQGTESLVRAREKSRKIKARDPQDFEPGRKSEAAVMRTTVDEPDMRFARNKNLYSPNPLLKVNGKPDNRFLNNREDILQAHAEEGTARPNVIFADDGEQGWEEDDPNAPDNLEE